MSTRFSGVIYSGDEYSKKIILDGKEDGPDKVQGGFYLFMPKKGEPICLRWATINGEYQIMERDEFLERIGDRLFSKKKLVEFESLSVEVQKFYCEQTDDPDGKRLCEDVWLDDHLVLSLELTQQIRNQFGDFDLQREYDEDIKNAFPFLIKGGLDICYCIINGNYAVRAWQNPSNNECGYDVVPLETIVIGVRDSSALIRKYRDLMMMPHDLCKIVFHQVRVETVMAEILSDLKLVLMMAEIEDDVVQAIKSPEENEIKNGIAQVIGDTFYKLKVPSLSLKWAIALGNYLLGKEVSLIK